VLQSDLDGGWIRWPSCDPTPMDGETIGLGVGITGLVAIDVLVHLKQIDVIGLVAIDVLVHLKPIDVTVSTAQCMYILHVRMM
jgi:hypothetical protein